MWPADDSPGNEDESTRRKRLKKRGNGQENNSISHGKIAAAAVGGVVVGALTAGIGLLAGMVIVGISAAAGGGAVVVQQAMSEREKVLVLGCDTYEGADAWVRAIEAQIRDLGSELLGLPYLPNDPLPKSEPYSPPQIRLVEVSEWVRSSKWKVVKILEGIRIFEQQQGRGRAVEHRAHHSSSSVVSHRTLDEQPPCYRINITLNGSPADAFITILTMPPPCLTGIIKSVRVVEIVDSNTDVIHMILQPVYLYPTWTCTLHRSTYPSFDTRIYSEFTMPPSP